MPSNEEAFEMFSQLFGVPFDSVPQPAPQPETPPQKTPVAGHFCNKCDSDLTLINIAEFVDGIGKPKKIFYCKNNHCKRFGLLTVVAKNIKLV